MLEPQGPLPPEIYWRRRALAVGVLVVVVAIVIGLIAWAAGGSDKSRRTAASSSLSSQTDVTLPPTASDSVKPGTGLGGDSGQPNASQAPGQSSAAGSSAPSSAPNGSANPTDVPASGLCPDQNISVVLYTDKPTYQSGDKPVFTLVVTNAGLSDCTRDVGKDMQNVTIRSLNGVDYIWSATDCAPLDTVNNMTLKPAQQFKDTIVWSGTTSSPGCKTPRVNATAGSYQASASLGTKQSAPVTFNVATPPGQ